MIIVKMDDFWLEEDREELKQITSEADRLSAEIIRLTEKIKQSRAENPEEPVTELLEERDKLNWKRLGLDYTDKLEALHKKVEQRYIDTYSDNPQRIVTTISEVLQAYTKEDFIATQEEKAKTFYSLKDDITDREIIPMLEKNIKQNYQNCCSCLYMILRIELNALSFYGLPIELGTELIEAKARTFYPKRATKKKIDVAELDSEARILKPFVAMLNGTATNQLTNISTRSNRPKVDLITNTATIQQGSVSVFIDSYNKITGELRTSTHKLLDTLTMLLTQQNNYRGKETDLKPTVSLPLEHFMELCGTPITKPSKDKARKKAKEDLETLYHLSIEWKETSGKNVRDFAKMRLCDKIGIVKGNIVFSFSQDMAKYLTNAYIMQYPIELLKVDERNPNSYHIGKKLLLHNSIDNNRAKGTANIISVKKLLEACPDIPSYEQVLTSDRAIDRRIKTPFEAGLNSLSSFIKWEYCNSKGVPLSEEQLKATDYNSFIQLFIKFDVIGTPDQTPRLERKRERKEQNKKAAEKKG